MLEYNRFVLYRIRSYCPKENGVIERVNRTFPDKLDDVELNGRLQAEEAIASIVTHYNTVRLHGVLGFKPPSMYYCGNSRGRCRTRAKSSLSESIKK